ncbi:MAG: cytidylate kinase-like family protein [Prevotella sp.]|nr:cytidylate kinase-like family protein [Prevotella sp.]
MKENNTSPLLICIGRQLGSGGLSVAKLLAEEFGCKLYDKELLNLAAKESGFSEKFFEQNDEQKGFLKSLFHLHAPHVGDNNFYTSRFSQDSLFQFQSDAIRKAAEEGPCVFVGRCADYVLRDKPHLFRIFLTADIEKRIEAVCNRRECDEQTARKIIADKESARASFYNFYTGKKWGQADSYDLCVNTSHLGIEQTAKFIGEFIERHQ